MDDELLVTVTPDDLMLMEDHGTIISLTGTSQDGKERVTFGGDRRMMAMLIDAIISTDEEQIASVPAWAVLGIYETQEV